MFFLIHYVQNRLGVYHYLPLQNLWFQVKGATAVVAFQLEVGRS